MTNEQTPQLGRSRSRADRRVHAVSFHGTEVVRYHRAGKWYLEYADGTRDNVGVLDAAEFARRTCHAVRLGLPGGAKFDKAVAGR